MTEELTPAMQQYLEVIFDLTQKQGEAGVAAIAQQMNVTKSGVSQALDMLKQLSMISHPRYGKVFLTSKGRKTAQWIRQKHDVLTRFFVEILGVDADTAEEDACKIEHVISRITFNKLLEFLESKE